MCPLTLPAATFLYPCCLVPRLSSFLIGHLQHEQRELHSFPRPTSSSCLSPQGHLRNETLTTGFCPARGSQSTHSLNAALRGASSARMLLSGVIWGTLLVHALAAQLEELGGRCETVPTTLLGLRRVKRLELSTVPSPLQENHPPPFPTPWEAPS